jgi:hypothetical protein
MSDYTPNPARFVVSAAALADIAAKQRAYEARRQMWSAGYLGEDDARSPATIKPAQRSGKIQDRRQRELAA